MREIRRRIRLPLGLLLLLAVVPAAKAAPPVAVFIDGGYVIPGGNLDAAHIGENSGLGSDPGLELGLGLRLPLSRSLALGLSFHFLDFGSFEGPDLDDEILRLETFSYRYALEVEFIQPGSRTRLRPFLGLGAGLYRNRLQVLLPELEEQDSRSVNTLGLSARLGVRWRGFELSWIQHRNRFDTWQFSDPAGNRSWNWDQSGLRIGWGMQSPPPPPSRWDR